MSGTKNTESYVVVERGSQGWSIAGGKLYRDKTLASMAASGMENAIVLPARRKRLYLEGVGNQPATKSILNVDWSGCEGVATEPAERWYVLRVAPGTQRTARPIKLPENATDSERADAYRRTSETIIERQLRNEGIDLYMPAFWESIRSHRGHKPRARRLPLYVGYVFVRCNPGKGFRWVKDVDGALGIVSIKQAPLVMTEDDVRFLMIQMFDREQAFKIEEAQEAEVVRFNRRQKLNAELGRHLPKGRDRRKISLRAYADQCIKSFPETIQERIMGIMSALDVLEQDTSLADFRE